MTKRILALAAAVLLVTTFVVAQTPAPYAGRFVQSLFSAVAADDTDVIMVVKYIGDQSVAATFRVNANTFIFTRAGAADTAIDTGALCGAVAGTLDLTDAQCDTVGEAVDIINASTNWRAVPLDALRADVLTAGITLSAAAQNAKNPDGAFVYWDTSGAFIHARALVSCRVASCLMPGLGLNVNRNPYDGTYTILQNFNVRSTYGAGTSTINIYGVVPSETGAGETATLLWTAAGGATTAYAALGSTQWPIGLVGPPNAKVIVRLDNSAAAASLASQAYALLYRSTP